MNYGVKLFAINLIVFATFLISSVTLISQPAFAISCSGNACSDVNLEWDGSCYTVKNYGGNSVRVQIGNGNTGTVKMTLRAGQRSNPILNPFGGGCRKTLGGSMRANYT